MHFCPRLHYSAILLAKWCGLLWPSFTGSECDPVVGFYTLFVSVKEQGHSSVPGLRCGGFHFIELLMKCHLCCHQWASLIYMGTLLFSSWILEKIPGGLESLRIRFSTGLNCAQFKLGLFFLHIILYLKKTILKNVMRPILKAKGQGIPPKIIYKIS